jgi:hypothetical protein
VEDLLDDPSSLVLAMLGLFPRSVRQSLISDSDFRRRYNLEIDAQVSFDRGNISFWQSNLFNAVRDVLNSAESSQILKDVSGHEWQMKLVQKENERCIEVQNGEHRFLISEYWALSDDQSERIKGFSCEVENVNLVRGLEAWREILAERPLTNDEQYTLHNEISMTPIRVAASIGRETAAGESDFSSLAPRSEQYFVRLIGNYQGSINIAEYAKAGLREQVQQLMAWRPYDGFLLALMLSAHSLTSSVIDTSELSDKVLEEAYAWIEKRGDRISQVGAIELGLSITDKRPWLVPYLKALVEKIRDDDPDDERGRLQLLSSLIMLVDGEISRTRTLSGKPPFWRRLASIAQASIVERGILGARVDIAKFANWALQARAQIFYLQTFVDLRSEPRWHPDSVSPRQLKAEFLGRIVGAAKTHASKIDDTDLHKLLLGAEPRSLESMCEFPFPYLPGPLEGGLESQLEAPQEMLKALEKQLSEEVLQPNSFAALVNSALIFRLDTDQARLAVKALRGVKHHLSQVEKGNQLLSLLSGLGTVAAVTRSSDLAEELRILTRKCRLQSGTQIATNEALFIGLIAAAAHTGLVDWCKFVGEWVTELAFQPLRSEEISSLRSHIGHLCQLVPELWHTCGRADAALQVAVGT